MPVKGIMYSSMHKANRWAKLEHVCHITGLYLPIVYLLSSSSPAFIIQEAEDIPQRATPPRPPEIRYRLSIYPSSFTPPRQLSNSQLLVPNCKREAYSQTAWSLEDGTRSEASYGVPLPFSFDIEGLTRQLLSGLLYGRPDLVRVLYSSRAVAHHHCALCLSSFPLR